MKLFSKRKSPISNDCLARQTAAQWLEKTRQRCAESDTKLRANYSDASPDFYAQFSDWRQQTRRTTKRYPGNWGDAPLRAGYPASSERPYYCDDFSNFREAGNADDIVRLDHNGWYTDHFCEETVRGVVLQLPARAKRHGGGEWYFPGVVWSDCDGVTCWPCDGYDTKEDAARAADGYAESIAEDERDYRAKDQAEMDIETAKEEIADARKAAHALILEIKAEKALPPTICNVVADRLREYRNDIHKAIATIHERRSDYWTAVSGFH